MKKIFITLMCIVMVVCFMPTVAMAGESDAVASVNGQLCVDLQEVIEKVSSETNTTGKVQIKLLKNIELPQTLKISENMDVELDLNGCGIAAGVRIGTGLDTKHYYAIDNYGKITIYDSVGSGEIRARGIENLGNGTMTIESGNFYSIDANGGACIWNEATLFVNGGTFETLHVGSSSDSTGVGCLNNSGTATITAGNFNDVNKRTYAIISTGDIEITPAEGKTVNVAGAHGGLGIDAGTAVVNGGTYTSTDYYGLYVSNDGVGTDPMTAAVTVNGGTFSGANYSVWIGSDYNNPVNSTIRINDGEFRKPLNAQENTREGAIVVAGGTFSSDDVSQYVPEGTKVVETTVDDVTKYTLAPINEGKNAAVAQVGDAGFTTLQAAINAAADGQTITLLNDVTVTKTIGVTKNITLDLGGHKVTGDDCRVLNVMKGKLELTGTGTVTAVKKAESGNLDPDSSVIRVGDNAAVGEGASKASAELIIGKDVIIAAPDTYGVTVFGSGTEETVTVYGTINATGTRAAISGNGSAGYGGTTINIEDGAEVTATQDAAIYHPQAGTLNINGRKISGTSGIEAKAGTINVTGTPTIKATGDKKHVPNGNGTSTSGYAIAVVDNAGYAGGTKADIKGGTFTGEIAALDDSQGAVADEKKGMIVVSGGSFNTRIDSSYLASGFVQSADGTVKVQAPTGGGGGGGAPATPQKPEIKPVTGGKVSLSADGTTATITPDAGKVVDKVLVNGKDMGAVTELKGLKTGDKIEVLFKDEVKEPSKAETDKQVKAHMQKLAPKARSLKTKAGNVKVSFEGQFKDIEALGYTVKYKFYRSTKKASGYKHMLTTSKPSYTNTGGKKGTLYYYKAIALAYDKDGKLIAKTELKQCKYASRRWTK